MGKGTTFENDLLKLIFQATAIANLADNAASAPLANLYLSLHTANPASGNQATSEVSYTGYARVAIVRTSSGWTISGNSVSPVSTISFVTCPTGTSSQTATYAAIGTASSGTGKVLYAGSLTPSVTIADGITPQVASTSTLTES